jgi:hypothetical protein
LPLITPTDATFQYTTLGQALATGDITITETSLAGSVPELMVINRGTKPVLLIDGEELAGAKQNRVLNTSILIKQVSETRIPVSCTEQGRWSYASKAFSESGNVMAHRARARKTNSVHDSLAACGAPVSNQHEVWDSIAQLQAKFCAHSPTSAMSDVYKAGDEELRRCADIFAPVANQVGLIAFIGGEPVGVDIVSLTSGYANLHPKLVRSYALEGLFPDSQHSTDDPQPLDASVMAARARQFLDEIGAAEERQFASVGHGTDYRYRPAAPNPTLHFLTGSALVHENEVIHAGFFRLDGPEQPRPRAPYRSRRIRPAQ